MARYMRTDLGRGHTKLSPPAVVGPGIYYRGVQVNLAAVRRVQQQPRLFARYSLRPPTVVTPPLGPIPPRFYLAAEQVPQANGLVRRQPYSRLRPPAVVTPAQVFTGPAVHLARNKVPPTQTVLQPFTSRAFEVHTGPQTSLAYQSRRPGRARLEPPADITEAHELLALTVNLAYSRRGAPKSRLQPPAVVAPVVSYGPELHLTYSRRGAPRSRLYAPSVVAQPPAFLYPVQTTLAYSRRGEPLSALRPPTVVFLAVEIYGPVVSLARNKVPQAYPKLQPPADITEAGEFPVVRVHLAYSRRGAPRSELKPFTERAFEVSYGPQTTLTYSRRGAPKSRLQPGIAGQPGFRGILVSLTPGRAGVARSRLEPPAVVGAIVYSGPGVNLTYSSRGAPTSFLKPPTVVASPPAYQQVLPPTFAYQRRGRPVWFLNPPTVVFPFIPRPTDVTLAPSHRLSRKTTYVLRPPRVVRQAVEIYGPAVGLAYSRRGRPSSFLLPPTVVDRARFYGPSTHLAYSRRGRPVYVLRPPRVVRLQVLHPIQVTLAAIKPKPTTALIKPPAVVFVPTAGELKVTLARILPPQRFWKLRPAAVIGEPERFFGPKVTLVRIKPAPTLTRLPVVVARFRRQHGDVCGFDIAQAVICYLEQPVSRVVGSTAPQSRIVGDDRKAT